VSAYKVHVKRLMSTIIYTEMRNFYLEVIRSITCVTNGPRFDSAQASACSPSGVAGWSLSGVEGRLA